MSGLKESYNSGNIIGIPSHNIRISKMTEVFPSPPRDQKEILAGFQSGFPDAITTVNVEPGNITLRTKWPEYPEWENTYVGVNQEPKDPLTLTKPIGIVATNGELIISRHEQIGLVINQVLSEGDELGLEEGKPHTIQSRNGWSIYHKEIVYTKESTRLPLLRRLNPLRIIYK
ncbi:hypothetical protein BH11PAT1_BH11PAT1_2180 [soil metagenome]